MRLSEPKDGHDPRGHEEHHAHDKRTGSYADRWEHVGDRDAKMKVAP